MAASSAKNIASALSSAPTKILSGIVNVSSAVAEPSAKGLVAGNEKFLVKEADLLKKFFYSKLASVPETCQAAKTELANFSWSKVNASEMTLTQGAVVAATAFEIYGFFCVGEIIGRGGHLLGYAYE